MSHTAEHEKNSLPQKGVGYSCRGYWHSEIAHDAHFCWSTVAGFLKTAETCLMIETIPPFENEERSKLRLRRSTAISPVSHSVLKSNKGWFSSVFKSVSIVHSWLTPELRRMWRTQYLTVSDSFLFCFRCRWGRIHDAVASEIAATHRSGLDAKTCQPQVRQFLGAWLSHRYRHHRQPDHVSRCTFYIVVSFSRNQRCSYSVRGGK